MTGENKTVEPTTGGLSGSLSGNKKNHSAQKKSDGERCGGRYNQNRQRSSAKNRFGLDGEGKANRREADL